MIRDYVATVKQTEKCDFIALMKRVKNAKDKDKNRHEKENKIHHRDTNRHDSSKGQGGRATDKDGLERRTQKGTEKVKEETQGWSDTERTEDEKIEELIRTVTEVRCRENRKMYTVQRHRRLYEMQILQQ